MNSLLCFSTASTVVVKKKKKKKQILRFDDVNVSDRNLIRVLNSEINCVVDSDLFTIVSFLYSNQINLYTMDFTVVIQVAEFRLMMLLLLIIIIIILLLR